MRYMKVPRVEKTDQVVGLEGEATGVPTFSSGVGSSTHSSPDYAATRRPKAGRRSANTMTFIKRRRRSATPGFMASRARLHEAEILSERPPRWSSFCAGGVRSDQAPWPGPPACAPWAGFTVLRLWLRLEQRIQLDALHA
jgi:hypothetical protein